MQKKKIILILLILLLILLIVQHKPILSYQQTNEKVNPVVICEKIRDQGLRKMCLSKIEHPDLQLPLPILEKIGEESEDMLLCHSIHLSKFLTLINEDSFNLNSFIPYNPYRSDQKPESPFFEYSLCYQSLVENPYYCRMLGSFSQTLGPADCYQDTALTWEDPSLCQKAKNKDRCFFRLALKIVRNDL